MNWLFLIVSLLVIFWNLETRPGWLNAAAGLVAIIFSLCFFLHYFQERFWSEKHQEKEKFIGSLVVGLVVSCVSYHLGSARFGLLVSIILGLYFGLGVIIREGEFNYGYYNEIVIFIRPMAIGLTMGWSLCWGLFQGVLTGFMFYCFFGVFDFLATEGWNAIWIMRARR